VRRGKLVREHRRGNLNIRTRKLISTLFDFCVSGIKKIIQNCINKQIINLIINILINIIK